MPVPVTKERPAKELQKGDVVQLVKGGKVTDVKRLRVNVEVTYHTGSTARIKLDEVIPVTRVELTEEDKEANREASRKHRRESLVRDVTKWFDEAEANRAKAIETMTKYLGCRGFDIDDVVAAQARCNVVSRYKHIVDNAREGKLHRHEPGVECEYTEPTETGRRCVKPTIPCTEYDGVLAAVEKMLEDAFHSALNRRAASRSSGVMHNLLEDYEAEVLAKFMQSLRWDVIDLPEFEVLFKYM